MKHYYNDRGYDVMDLSEVPENWILLLRRDDIVWCVKQNCIATIEYPYENPKPLFKTGEICLRQNSPGLQRWFISENGKGIDGSQCLLPIRDGFSETPQELPCTEVRRLEQMISELSNRLSYLEQKQWI